MILIAATNRNLKREILSGNFREDLYHRFTYKITLPDLKDRKEDFRFLLSFALQKMARKSKIKAISIQAIEYLEKFNFPGNFRELESRCSRAISNAEIAGRNLLLKVDFEDF
jgi:DNA-binding NtrC family response regulator